MASKNKTPLKKSEKVSEKIIPDEEITVIEETPDTVEPIKTSFPYETTIAVSLAVLRKNIMPGTLKPVATLKQGDKVTVTDVSGEYAQLKNGLWVAVECLAK